MGYQINKYKLVNGEVSLQLFKRQFYVVSVSGVFTSHYRFLNYLFSIHFNNVLVHVYSGATQYVHLTTSSVPKTS